MVCTDDEDDDADSTSSSDSMALLPVLSRKCRLWLLFLRTFFPVDVFPSDRVSHVHISDDDDVFINRIVGGSIRHRNNPINRRTNICDTFFNVRNLFLILSIFSLTFVDEEYLSRFVDSDGDDDDDDDGTVVGLSLAPATVTDAWAFVVARRRCVVVLLSFWFFIIALLYSYLGHRLQLQYK